MTCKFKRGDFVMISEEGKKIGIRPNSIQVGIVHKTKPHDMFEGEFSVSVKWHNTKTPSYLHESFITRIDEPPLYIKHIHGEILKFEKLKNNWFGYVPINGGRAYITDKTLRGLCERITESLAIKTVSIYLPNDSKNQSA